MSAGPIGAGGTITLDGQYVDGTGTAVDPVTPLVDIIDPNGVTLVNNAAPTAAGPVGAYQYAYAVPGAGPVGSWTIHWTGVINGVAVEADEVFSVVAAGAVSFPSAGGGGVCAPWATIADVCSPCDDYEFDVAVLEQGLEWASEILFHLTRRRWPGVCSDTVRPMAQWRTNERRPRGRLGAGGSWCSCNRPVQFGCSSLSMIRLGGLPLVRIDAVKVDGDIVPAGEYRIDDYKWLVGLEKPDGTLRSWPCCQQLHLPDTEDGTFSVAYEYGAEPPAGGIAMAAVLGCELALSCQPETVGSCRLPKAVTSVTRQGITIAKAQSLFSNGETGLPEVDLWVAAINKGDANRRATVVVPGHSGRGVRRADT